MAEVGRLSSGEALGLTGQGWTRQSGGGQVILPVVNHNHRRLITATPTNIVYQRRVVAVTEAIRRGNVSKAARLFGVARQTLSEWKQTYQQYGAAALRPKERRPPQMPNATPDHVIEQLARLAVMHPSEGARWYAEQLSDGNYQVSKSCVQTYVNRLGLGRREW